MSSQASTRNSKFIKASQEAIYRAFTDAGAMAAWLPPYGFVCEVHQMDARVGGNYRMSFTNFSTGNSHSFGGTYVELVGRESDTNADILIGGADNDTYYADSSDTISETATGGTLSDTNRLAFSVAALS